MTSAMAVSVPSPQTASSTAGTRTSARRGSDGPSAGATRFDAMLAGHAAPPKPPQQANVKPSPEAQTRGADKPEAIHSSDQPAKAGSALKSTRAGAAGRDDAAPTIAGAPAPPAAADLDQPIAAEFALTSSPAAPDLADSIAAEFAPTSLAGVPTAPGVGVVPVLASSVPPAARSTASDAPVLAPGSGSAVVVVPAPTSSQPHQGLGAAGAGAAPTAVGSGVAPEPSTPAAATSSTIPAAPTLSPGTGSAGPEGEVAGGASVVVPGTGSVAPADLRVALGQPVDPGVGADPTHPIAAEVSASVAKTPIAPGSGAVPLQPTGAAPATTSTTPAQPEAAAPMLAQGTGSADPAADGSASGKPGSTGHSGPEATTVVQVSLGTVSLDQASVDQVPSGQPVVVATSSSSSQPQLGAEATGAGGAPTAPAPGVVPVLTGLVPPAAMSTASAAPAMGQPASFLLPAAVHQQVLTAVSPLLRGPDGSYGIELQLHPQDLGAVRVTVDVRLGEISIQMHSTDAAARDALRGGLSDLRQQLEDQGLRAGSMEVGSGGANARQPETSWSGSEGIDAPERSPVPPDPLVAPAAGASSNSLDLRM